MKIYTRGGDRGTTSLLSGKIVPKHHLRIESYGTVDELIAFCGLLRDSYSNEYYTKLIAEIQDRLMTIASLLANDDTALIAQLPSLYEEDVVVLEKEIDKMEEQLPPIRTFVLPGGNYVVSVCHVTRTVCRRAERVVIRLSEEEDVNPLVIKYLNRLSDFLFVLSRLISRELDVKETNWKPKL